MSRHRYPGGLIRAKPLLPTLQSASGMWTLTEAMQYQALGIWPRVTTTWNPSDKDAAITLSNGNLTAACTLAASTSAVRSVRGVSSGTYYWELTINTANQRELVGVMDGASSIAALLGSTATSYGYFGFDGQKRNNGSFAAYGAAFTNNDVISVLLDMDAGTLTFWKNGVTQGQAFSGLTGTLHAAFGGGSGSFTEQVTANFGASGTPFAYARPLGYGPLPAA